MLSTVFNVISILKKWPLPAPKQKMFSPIEVAWKSHPVLKFFKYQWQGGEGRVPFLLSRERI
jgi:hypothetical protein